MRLRTVALLGLAVLAALLLAAPVAAKDVVSARFCGQSNCRGVTDPAIIRQLPIGGGPSEVKAPPAHPFYIVDLGIGDRAQNVIADHFVYYYVPAEEKIGSDRFAPNRLAWFAVAAGPIQRAMHQSIDGIEPYPSPKGWRVEFLADPALLVVGPSKAATPRPAKQSQDDGMTAGRVALIIILAAATLVAGIVVYQSRRGGKVDDEERGDEDSR